MDEIFVIYSLTYIIIAFCFVYKTDLFVSVGLTVESLFQSHLGREQDNFIMYHVKKSCIITILHRSIPHGFFIGLCIFKVQTYLVTIFGEFLWQIIFFGSFSIPIYSLYNFICYYQHDWNKHPVFEKLKLFENERYNSWIAVQNEINSEYKQLDKTILHCGNRMKLILTRNWIVKVTSYDLDIANQNDARLVVYGADTHDSGNNGHFNVMQFINVKVFYYNESREFYFRLHAFDFKDLKDGLHCPIEVSNNVTFHQTKLDEFLEIFKELVESNPKYPFNDQEIEMCMGCMTTEANVKLIKNCIDEQSINNTDNGASLPLCISCRCRPLWCVDCMGKWFASRQNQSLTETWLSSKCPCPVCRSMFCMLDISPIVRHTSRPVSE